MQLRESYWCDVFSIHVQDVNDRVFNVSISGIHLPERTDDDVTHVMIFNSNAPMVFKEFFEKFTNIFQYFKSGGGLQYIQSNALHGSRSLEIFAVHQNLMFTTIHSHAFAGATNLRTIDFTGCAIENIHEFAFFGLSGLNQLNLQNNRIHTLPINVFRPLIRLLFLFLNGNQLETISGQLFTNNNQLHQISLSLNRINAIDRNFLQPLGALLFLSAVQNSCVNGNFVLSDVNANQTIQESFQNCFDNFDNVQM